MSYRYGNRIQAEITGSSHGDYVAVDITGLPKGFRVDTGRLQRFLDRRAPGKSVLTTSRRESDRPVFESGMEDGVLSGEVLRAVICNTSQDPSAYEKIKDTPRPSHADLTARIKYGSDVDMRGGGAFSGRMTAPVCVAGGIALQILESMGIYAGAHLCSVGPVTDEAFPLYPDRELFSRISEKELSVIDDEAGAKMREIILSCASQGDSVGGTVECAVTGVPAGLGGPLFEGVEGRIAYAVFGIPGAKGVEFGAGFGASAMKGSECNDPFIIKDGEIRTETNNSAGIQGGITNGMPVVFRAAFKPTPSISVSQKTVSLSRMEETEISVTGRHDPCIAVRAVPVVESVTALALLDLIVEEKEWNLLK